MLQLHQQLRERTHRFPSPITTRALMKRGLKDNIAERTHRFLSQFKEIHNETGTHQHPD